MPTMLTHQYLQFSLAVSLGIIFALQGDVLRGWKSLPAGLPPRTLARGTAYWRGWVSPFPRPGAGSVAAAWWERKGLGEGNGRSG